ncbi:MAG: N-acetylmuramoyl-L-alanine amidase [Bergeyella sp.]|nr:N-acetylmuramoyl-L-alanine amidase [Bergeyella sp.]
MRPIRYIAVHCTATSPEVPVSAIQQYWKRELGWKYPGYHYLIKADGKIVNLLPLSQPANGVKGHNATSVNISYIGGIDLLGNPKDTRTDAQKRSLLQLIKSLKKRYPAARIQGHRDFTGVKKACPSFDAKEEYKNIGPK